MVNAHFSLLKVTKGTLLMLKGLVHQKFYFLKHQSGSCVDCQLKDRLLSYFIKGVV